MPFFHNLSIYLSGVQLTVHRLVSGLDYDEPLRDREKVSGVSGGLLFFYLYYTADGLLSLPIA